MLNKSAKQDIPVDPGVKASWQKRFNYLRKIIGGGTESHDGNMHTFICMKKTPYGKKVHIDLTINGPLGSINGGDGSNRQNIPAEEAYQKALRKIQWAMRPGA